MRRHDCAAIALTAALVGLALRPFPDTPFGDDWTYAWSVEHLLGTGELRFLEWSAHLNVVQVLWGALFCLPVGFSFAALRLSTWTLAAVGLCALYLLLRELGAGRRSALLGTATLGLNPIFFVLATTFMTDVPFLALMVAGSYAFVRAVREERDGWLVAASGLAAAAIGVRALGAAIPLAMAAALLLHAGRWGRRPARLLIAVAPLALLGLLLWWGSGRLEPSADIADLRDAPETRYRNLAHALRLLPRSVVLALTDSANVLGIALLPLVVARGFRGLGPSAVGFAALFGGFVLARSWLGESIAPALAPGWTWSIGELGLTEPFVPDHRPADLPRWWTWASTLAWIGSISLASAMTCARRVPPGGAYVAWLLAGQLGLMAVLWLFHLDRYALAPMPLAIALVLAGGAALRPRVAAAALALFAVVSVVGTRDHLAYNRALWSAVEALRSRGVADRDIDGGYVVNGWLHYAHPERAPRSETGEIVVPGLTSGATLRYRVSNAVPPGWRIVETRPYRRWLGRSGAIHVLERPAA